ncbi:MAG: translation elongation factor Ts [Verrucomicrobiota bacterium]
MLGGGQGGALIEVNCETDFVARNDSFKAFVGELATKAASQAGVDLESDRVAAVARIGENIQVRRVTRLEVQGTGALAAYIHTGGKVGVMVEVGATNPATIQTEEFKQLLRDVTLQIAAASPIAVSRAEVPQEIVDKEREIASQSDALKGKPAAAMEGILKGKLNKYFETNCLLEQGFVKNPDLKVEAHLGAVGKQLGDTLSIRRFLRYPVGE